MSLRVAWASDIHLNFPNLERVEGFIRQVQERRADAVVISGDIAEAHDLEHHLLALADALERPIYFVLGNHDYYKGSIRRVRQLAARLSRTHPWLWWLPDVGVLELISGVGLVGHGGWGDARLGDFLESQIVLNDYCFIAELSGITQKRRYELLRTLGEEAATFLREQLPIALRRFEREVIFVTHAPPFREACLHAGRICDDQWLPHYSCGALGEALLEVVEQFPHGHVTVLCGHTHSAVDVEIRPNLRVKAASATYGKPVLAEVFEFV